ncbi:YqgE/AlgH family protein [Magnetospira sp. QH-2]|uniref:YqgE/AlgH family protein n=1 Tax=Magnetospira sp. (strain QH-2) TaxID=1288970 RepID=UPI0003E81482|nr:YqgE/AlgH family protein [Magnetospira sp. QH-2]CCQ75213.1 conserved protein of unknown function [Magnetospira sp. QH-2]
MVRVLVVVLFLGLPVSIGRGLPVAVPPDPVDSLVGHLLVAKEDLQGSVFGRTVLLVVAHDSDGAVAVIVNRPGLPIPLSTLLTELGIDESEQNSEIQGWFGGPVDPGLVMMLHSPDAKTVRSQRIIPGVYLSKDRLTLQSLTRREPPKPSRLLFGYAGWGPGQLEAEIEQGFWAIRPARPKWVFTEDPAALWEVLK